MMPESAIVQTIGTHGEIPRKAFRKYPSIKAMAFFFFGWSCHVCSRPFFRLASIVFTEITSLAQATFSWTDNTLSNHVFPLFSDENAIRPFRCFLDHSPCLGSNPGRPLDDLQRGRPRINSHDQGTKAGRTSILSRPAQTTLAWHC